jgi:IclR family transcriptional regulator, acetate operon repressor
MLSVTAVLDLFLDARTDVGVSEVAAATGTSKSVAHRVLTALVTAGFVSADAETHRYRLGGKLLRLAAIAVGDGNLQLRAHPHLRTINERTNETALLCALRGDSRVYLDQIEARHPVRTSMPLGEERPLFLGSSGKAMLAFLPEDFRLAVVQRAGGVRRADGTMIRATALTAELNRIRRRGYALASDELAPGLAAVAAPVFDARGRVIASLGVAGLSNRTSSRRLLQYAALARAEARSLSRELGWSAEG